MYDILNVILGLFLYYLMLMNMIRWENLDWIFLCLIVCVGYVIVLKKKKGKCKRDKGCIKIICIDVVEFWINNYWWKDLFCKMLVKDVIMLFILIEIFKSDMFLVKY